ncbi:hypothetical protein KGF54_003636 [Candida jiufengensis]|uniref:uncharacterized protein n=1 Tax=Candida jiufengensis TaxID=497108 RepID=UPI0022245EF3|nr:uncharacterized protein KGF54_003636 [Candida jiufengensis]KAI5952769.1 hypothetical protein KGF54_003636 [Candida jiufengensis]
MVTCSDISFISSSFSIISCISWVFAQLPQIITNYTLKSAEGISPSFLLLWFLGDFLSFTSCLINKETLKFQLYLSIFFLCNDITLCFQYYYYNSIYPKHLPQLYTPIDRIDINNVTTNDIEIHQNDGIDIIKHSTPMQRLNSEDGTSSTPSSYNSTDEGKFPIIKSVAGAVLMNASKVNALSTNTQTITLFSNFPIGRILAWGCTIVYCSSRCPQLYKNYKRKSVEGISPLLFGSALLGNLTYTISILTSCSFVLGENRYSFIWEELPYILGSSGTIIFDAAYFYQKYLYRNSGINTSTMTLEPWNDDHTV